VQSREQYVLFHAAGVGFDALKNARMKRVEKIAVAQEKANHLRALFENPARPARSAETRDAE